MDTAAVAASAVAASAVAASAVASAAPAACVTARSCTQPPRTLNSRHSSLEMNFRTRFEWPRRRIQSLIATRPELGFGF